MDEIIVRLITEVIEGAPAVGGLALALYVMARQNGRLIALVEKICVDCRSETCKDNIPGDEQLSDLTLSNET